MASIVDIKVLNVSTFSRFCIVKGRKGKVQERVKCL